MYMRIIGGKDSGRKIQSPKSDRTRPSSDRLKESLFNILRGQIKGASCLDLFAGSGALGLEMISRGAEFVYLCDNSRESQRIIEENIKDLGYEDKTRLLKTDFRKVLKREYLSGHIDLIYIDPPYNKGLEEEALDLILTSDNFDHKSLVIVETEYVLKSYPGYELCDQRKYGRAVLTFLKGHI